MQFFFLFLFALGACALTPPDKPIAVQPLEQMDCLYGICLEDTADVLSKKGCFYSEDYKDWKCPLPDRVRLYTQMSADGRVIRVSSIDWWKIDPTIAERTDETGMLRDEKPDDPPWLRMAVVRDNHCRSEQQSAASKKCLLELEELIAQEHLFLMKEMGWIVAEDACETPNAYDPFPAHYLRHPHKVGCRTVMGDTVITEHPQYRSLRFPQYALHFDGSGTLGSDNLRLQAAK